MPRPHSISLVVVLAASAQAFAHGDRAGPATGEWYRHWRFDWLLVGSLLLIALFYAHGLTRLWRAAGRGRGVSVRSAGAFAAGVGALVLALVSPIDGLAEELSWVHMVQHMLLMMVAAPLFILGAPALVSLWALPAPSRRRAGRAVRAFSDRRVPRYLLWQPVAVWVLFGVTMWVWHIRAFYEAALNHRRLHDVQHIVFFVAACLFWRVLLDPFSRLRLNPALGVLYLFTSSLHATLLGVFMALSPCVWYPYYAPRTTAWNLGPLEDQQIAGFIMWMPACMLYAVAAALIFGLWLGRPEPEPRVRLPE